jgi:hypothetical protein
MVGKERITMGKRGLGFWVFALAFACLATGVFAAEGTCMRFLKIATIPRIAAMGDATASVPDATHAQTNPAHLVNIDGSLITFSHTSWFEDIRLETLTLGSASGKHGFGLGVSGLHTEPLKGYDDFDVPQGTFRFYDLLISGSYAYEVLPSLRLGATGKMVYEKIDWDSATGFALDLGLGYTGPKPLFGGHMSVGLVVRDLGPKMGYFDEKFDLPLTFQGGVSYSHKALPGDLNCVLALDYERTRDQDSGALFGAELGYRDVVAARVGYRGTYKNGDLAFGLGAGLHPVLVDYAYSSMGDDLGNTHRVAIGFLAGAIFPSPTDAR